MVEEKVEISRSNDNKASDLAISGGSVEIFHVSRRSFRWSNTGYFLIKSASNNRGCESMVDRLGRSIHHFFLFGTGPFGNDDLYS